MRWSILWLAILPPLLAARGPAVLAAQAATPNILWITCEDISPDLGCYGQPYARTPILDRLATQSVRYTHAFAPIGVCAPARSTIISGMWPPSIGSQHMRCQGLLPTSARLFPAYLRDAGYYCTNNSKTDYNLAAPADTWDESSARAHWRNRRPDQPFFAVFNFTTTHESQIRQPEAAYREKVADLPPADFHDPASAPIPPYHPDTPTVRRDWARYHDMISVMDRQVGRLLDDLEADGLADETIVFYYSDHGAGMPRSKRWLYDSSLRVPFLVRFPDRFQALAPSGPGFTTDRLLTFVDLAPTVLALAGVDIPPHFQGRPFLGPKAGPPREYVHGFRDRMDERTDFLRMARDHRFKYIRNYRPDLPYFSSQHISYLHEMPTMREWQRLADSGSLSGPPALWMGPTKPFEELYDTEADPWEIRNLAADPAHQADLDRLRVELDRWQAEIIDLGFLNEADLRSRFGETPPHNAVRSRPESYPFARLAETALLAAAGAPADRLLPALGDPDPSVRFWAIVGLSASRPSADLSAMLHDPSPFVRVAAARSLARPDDPGRATSVLLSSLRDPSPWVRLQAADAIDQLQIESPAARDALSQLAEDTNEYVRRVIAHALGLQVAN